MNLQFHNLFGIDQNSVKQLCILTPFLTRELRQGLGLEEQHPGKPYRCYQHHDFTLIETRIGALFTGDAILQLANSACRTLVFIGTCGSLDSAKFPIGTIVVPESAFALESFTLMLSGKPYLSPVEAKHILPFKDDKIKIGCCLSTGSIALQQQYTEFFHINKINVVDMECAAVLTASHHIKRKVLPFLHVADIIGQTSPFDHDDSHKILINRAQKHIIFLINQLIDQAGQAGQEES